MFTSPSVHSSSRSPTASGTLAAKYGMSRGEYASVKKAVGGMDKLFDEKSKAYEQQFIKYLAHDEDKEEKLFEHPELFKTPIVRNGRQATVGYCPEIWKDWE